MRSRRRVRIRQVDVDFLCLSVFGQRSLPDDMAERIAIRREFYDAVKDPLARIADPGPLPLEVGMEAVVA